MTIEQLMADPEIAPFLDFDPVPRKVKRPDGWTPERQRHFIAWLAHTGVPFQAAIRMGKNVSGIEALYRQQGTESFRAAWDGAIALHSSREEEQRRHTSAFAGRAPGIRVRGSGQAQAHEPLPGQILNEEGEWEDEQSYADRAEEAGHSLARKLIRIRRLFLQEISSSPGKRAAFEILTELPIDWEKAANLQPQDDEPYKPPNLMRQPDMILTAESGWSFGELGYGPDKKKKSREAIDRHRAEEGLEAVDWTEDDAQLTASSPAPIPALSKDDGGDPPASPPPESEAGPKVRRL